MIVVIVMSMVTIIAMMTVLMRTYAQASSSTLTVMRMVTLVAMPMVLIN